MNLITDPWIPVGGRLIRPADTVTVDGRPEWGRADLDLATYELLIGLVSVGDPPVGDSPMEQDDDWHERLVQPRQLQLDWLAPFFEAGAFMQDPTASEKTYPPSRMLAGAPGNKTLEEGATWATKLDAGPMPLNRAVIALYALNQLGLLDGQAERAPMRGGGPLVTLAWPREGTLWQRVWANVGRGWALPDDLSRVFPWLAPVWASPGGEELPPAEDGPAGRPWGHPLQAFFGMPRRIKLVIEGDQVISIRQSPRGVKYTRGPWRHPLTPWIERDKGSSDFARPKVDFGYREWAPAVQRCPSQTVALWRDRWPGIDADVMTAGLAPKSGKLLSLVEAYVPLLREAPNPQPLLDLAENAAFALRKAGGDAAIFWAETETDFRRALAGGSVDWPAILTRRALAIFDRVDVLAMTPTDRRKRLDGRRSLTRKLKELTDG